MDWLFLQRWYCECNTPKQFFISPHLNLVLYLRKSTEKTESINILHNSLTCTKVINHKLQFIFHKGEALVTARPCSSSVPHSLVLSELYWVCDKIVPGNHERYLYISHVNHWVLIISIHWGRCRMAAIFQTTCSNAFSWMKIYAFRLRFYWTLFPRNQLMIFQHWFR